MNCKQTDCHNCYEQEAYKRLTGKCPKCEKKHKGECKPKKP